MLKDLSPESLDRIIDRVRARLVAEQAARQAFQQSEVFRRMLTAMASPGARIIHQDEGEPGYLENLEQKIGWGPVSLDDVRMFMRIVADSSVHDGDPDKIVYDPACDMFPVFYFENFGLVAWVMIGQGTSISISTREHARNEQCPLYAADTVAPRPDSVGEPRP